MATMQFADRALLRLTDTSERTAIFTPSVGDRALAAAFEFRSVVIGAATGVSVRDLNLLPSSSMATRVNANLIHPTTGNRWDALATLVDAGTKAAAHATLDLRITTETRIADTTIATVDFESLADLGGDVGVAAVDARIVADDGALPGNPGALATRRFGALKTLLFERFDQPADVDIDALVAARGATDFASLHASLSEPRRPSRVALDLVIDGTLPSRIATHRVVAAVLIEESPVDRLLDLVEQVQIGRRALEETTDSAAPPSGMATRVSLPFIIVAPAAAFDDADLPVPAGANPGNPAALRAAHLTELHNRLVPFGIAIAPVG